MWGTAKCRLPQMLFKMDLDKEAFLGDPPLQLPGSLPYVAMRARSALREIGWLQGEQHTQETICSARSRIGKVGHQRLLCKVPSMCC